MYARLKIALLAVLFLLAPACSWNSGAPPTQTNNNEVLDTSSPDEPNPQQVNDYAAASAQNLFLKASNSNSTIANKVLSGTSYTGPIVISSGAETLTKIKYQRWSLTNDYLKGENAKWGILLYNEKDCVYVNVNITGIKAEHAIYQHSPTGTVLLQDVHVYDCGAQGFQQVWRGAETSDPLGYQKVGVHRLERCTFIKCGQLRGIGRASFCVSMFGWQSGGGSTPRQFWNCPVELLDVTIEHDSKGQYELRGALLVEWRPSVLIKDCRINYVGTSDRDLVHLYENDAIRVENSYIHGPAGKYFDIDGKRTQSVVFTSPNFDGGDTPVRINGVKVGTTDDEIVWHK